METKNLHFFCENYPILFGQFKKVFYICIVKEQQTNLDIRHSDGLNS